MNTGSSSSLIRNIGNSSAEMAELTISGGELEQMGFIAVKNDDYGSLKVTGGTIRSNEQAVQNWMQADITGGTLDGPVYTWAYNSQQSTTNISGNAVVNGDVVVVNYQNASVTPQVNIMGGTVSGSLKKAEYDDKVNFVEPGSSTSDINISGGSFKNSVDPDYCADGFAPNKGPDGSYTVHKHELEAVVGKAPSCTQPGHAAGWRCKLCGMMFADADGKTEIAVIPATGHGFDRVNHDENNHWKECACGERSEVKEHVFGSWTMDKQAGLRHRVCITCGRSFTETLPAGGTTAPSIPQTGDTFNVWLFTGLLGAGLAGLAALAFVKSKQRKTDR